MQQKETYMRGNRILLGAVSIILFIAGLTNYCNVIFTGMYATGEKNLNIDEKYRE